LLLSFDPRGTFVFFPFPTRVSPPPARAGEFSTPLTILVFFPNSRPIFEKNSVSHEAKLPHQARTLFYHFPSLSPPALRRSFLVGPLHNHFPSSLLARSCQAGLNINPLCEMPRCSRPPLLEFPTSPPLLISDEIPRPHSVRSQAPLPDRPKGGELT